MLIIYRPPSENTLKFIEKVNEIISGVTKGNKHFYITGDFNLDLLKHESHSVTAQFIESLFAFSFLPMITKPTRITAWDFSDQANNANDPNTAYNIFIDKHTGLFDACFPFKTIKGKALNSFRKLGLGLQRAYLGQSIRKVSYISNTFGIDQMENFSNPKRIKRN